MHEEFMSGGDEPIAGMGGFAGQKVVHPLARRASPSLRYDKNFLREMKMVTPRWD